MNDATHTAKARNEYRTLRASCARHSAARFDELARNITHELSDGEDVTPGDWLHAARILVSGYDCA